MTSPIRRPFWARSERPTALMMPAVTVDSKPSGLPIAMAICPGLSFLELPSRAAGKRSVVSARSTAMSCRGRSRPSTRAVKRLASVNASSMAEAPSTTWLLVEHDAIRRQDGAGARALGCPALARAAYLHVHDRRGHGLDHADHGAGIGVEQLLVLAAAGSIGKAGDIGNERRFAVAISAPQSHVAPPPECASAHGPTYGADIWGAVNRPARGRPAMRMAAEDAAQPA